MSSLPFCKRGNETCNVTDFICYDGNIPFIVRTGHKETSQFAVRGKLPGVEENLLAVRGTGGGNDRGVYGGKSREEETWEKI